MIKRRVLTLLLSVAAAVGCAAVPAYGFIHNSQYNQTTIRHGLYRGGSTTDGAMQVSDNVVTGGWTSSNKLRISLYHGSSDMFYDYICTNSDSCYHNHTGGYAECSYAGGNGYYDSGSWIMSFHRNQDTDYCGG